jgi:hypothetical protein
LMVLLYSRSLSAWYWVAAHHSCDVYIIQFIFVSKESAHKILYVFIINLSFNW